MPQNELARLLNLTDKVAKDAGYSIDWTSYETAKKSISEMDYLTMLAVKCSIDITQFYLLGATEKELTEAGITLDNVLGFYAGSNSDASPEA